MLYRFRNTCLRWAKRWRTRCALLATAWLASGPALAQPIGNVTTLGGTGEPGYAEGVQGVSQFRTPSALALRDENTLFIADFNNDIVRSMRLTDSQTFPFAKVRKPIGLAFDSKTNLFVASQADSAIIKFDYFRNPRQTNKPALSGGTITALAIDRDDNLYIAQQGGVVTRLDSKGVVQAELRAPTAGLHEFHGVAVSDDGIVFVSDAAAHVIWRFKGSTGELFAGTLNQTGNQEGEIGFGRLSNPQQIAVGLNSSVVIADRGNHQVRVASCDGVISVLFGIDPSQWFTVPVEDAVGVFPGWWDSSAEFAEVREPVGIAVDRLGNVFDTEVFYNLVRVGTGLYVPPGCNAGGSTTPTTTPPVLVLNPKSGFYPNGITITITASNSVTGFTRDTRLFYTLNASVPTKTDLEIEIDADGRARLTLPGPIDLANLRVRAFIGDVGGRVTAAEPTQVPTCLIAPDSGYYPMGVDIVVTSTNGFPEGTLIYYELDGTVPTTNSPTIKHDGTRGTLSWRDATRDLRSLQVKAFLGPNQGKVTTGKAVRFEGEPEIQGEVGIPPARNGYKAGIGSFYILPIIANLRDNQELRSLIFDVELSALPGSPWLEKSDLTVLPMSTNDFIKVLPGSLSLPVQPAAFARNGTNHLGIAYVGTNTGFSVTAGYATIALLGIQFRGEDTRGNRAQIGNGYKLRITNLSGTSDGIQTSLPLKVMDDVTILFDNIQFREGDTAPAYWYNAGDFGDGLLQSEDANAAIFASFGFLRPFPLTDAFSAMDVYRIGVLENVVEFNDAATILRRILRYESPDFFRVRDESGEWQSSGAPKLASAKGIRALSTEKPAWTSDVTIYGGVLDKVEPSQTQSIPIYIKTAPGVSVSGMQFVADLVPVDGAPPVHGISFSPSSEIPQPNPYGSEIPGRGVLPSTVFARWDSLGANAFKGTVLLGFVQFVTPSTVQAGQHYNLVFHNTGGAAVDDEGFLTPYIFQSIHGEVWPFAPAPAIPQIADEWKAHFFGSSNEAETNPDEDPDQDGFTNIEEFLGGTDPNTPDWHVKVVSGQVLFRWLGRAGKSYSVEKTQDFGSWNAVSGRMTGQDTFLQYNELTIPGKAQFYRLNIQ
jgi:hypothetical protein